MSHSHQAGFVTIIGQPNVGKSTLMNQLVGERLAIITPKSQTTRHTLCAILNGTDYQIIFTDTPGILKPAYALQEAMMHNLTDALAGTDLILWMLDMSQNVVSTLAIDLPPAIPIIVLLNKVDLIKDPAKIQRQIENCRQLLPNVKEILPISARLGLHVDDLIRQILCYLPQHPAYYPADMLTDRPERFFVTEIVREQILRCYQEEIPYAVEVCVEQFKEMPKFTHIGVIIYVEKQSQKGILIGKGGAGLKQVGTLARAELEVFLDRPVFLEQHVKVLPHWRHEKKTLQRLGYLPL